MRAALAEKDASRVYTYARAIAGGTRGPRKRELRVPATENPSASEFEAYLAQSGPEGGCRAIRGPQPKRRRGFVQVDNEGNYTYLDTDAYRAEMTIEAWEQRDNLIRERRTVQKGRGLFECSRDVVKEGEHIRRQLLLQGWNKHKRKRERDKVLKAFSWPPGHQQAGTSGKGDFGDGPWLKGHLRGPSNE